MKKRLLALFLCLAIALTLLSTPALAAVGETFQATNEGVEIWYRILSEPDGSGVPGTAQVGTAPPDASSYGIAYRAVDASILDPTTAAVTVPASVSHEGETYAVVSVGIAAFITCDKLESVALPDTVTTIGKSAFTECSKLTSIALPAATTIGESAFSRCASLASVTLPVATTIGEAAFESCVALTSVHLPESLESIGGNGFYDSGLTSVALPAACASIGADAFSNCVDLTEITVDPANERYRAEDDVLYDIDKTTLHTYPRGKRGSSFIVPASVTAIEGGAFLACDSLTWIILPAGLTRIGESAFINCVGLTWMSFPAGLREIGAAAFANCTALVSLSFAGSAPDLGIAAFEGVPAAGALCHPVGAAGYGTDFGSFTIMYSDRDPLKDWDRVPIYAVAYTLTGLTMDGLFHAPTDNSADYVATLTPADGYRLPAAIIVTVGGVELAATEYSYDSASGVLSIGKTKITGDIEITAEAIPPRSTRPNYRLTWNVNGGGGMAGISGAMGTVIDLDKYLPVREGYEFLGWYADAELTRPIHEFKLIGNAVVYAKWREIGRVNPFLDVRESDWFYEDVLTAYYDGLVHGRTKDSFAPYESVTIAEAVKLAACMRQLYTDGAVTLGGGDSPLPWYQPYGEYAAAQGIIAAGQFADFEAAATRAQLAEIFVRALPEDALAEIYDIPDNAIPDVSLSDSYGPAVYRLYRVGALRGNDALLTFAPGREVKRCEIAALIARMTRLWKRAEN